MNTMNINPQANLSEAYKFALLTGQLDFCQIVEGVQNEFNALCNELVNEGKLPKKTDEEGFSGGFYQEKIEAGLKETGDQRFFRLAQMTKLRFMIELQPASGMMMN